MAERSQQARSADLILYDYLFRGGVRVRRTTNVPVKWELETSQLTVEYVSQLQLGFSGVHHLSALCVPGVNLV